MIEILVDDNYSKLLFVILTERCDLIHHFRFCVNQGENEGEEKSRECVSLPATIPVRRKKDEC